MGSPARIEPRAFPARRAALHQRGTAERLAPAPRLRDGRLASLRLPASVRSHGGTRRTPRGVGVALLAACLRRLSARRAQARLYLHSLEARLEPQACRGGRTRRANDARGVTAAITRAQRRVRLARA